MKRGFLNKSVTGKKKEKQQSGDLNGIPSSASKADKWSQLTKDLLDAMPLSNTMADQWLLLPKDLIDSIINRLNLSDLIRFSCVCRSWSFLSSPLLPPKLNPWLIVPCGDSTGQTNSVCSETLGFFSLHNDKVYKMEIPEVSNRRMCGSCQGGWLVTVHLNGELQLLHPFSKAVINLPPVSKLPGVVGSVDEKGELVYNVPMSIGGFESIKEISSVWVRDSYVYKAIMSSLDPNTAILMAIQGFSKKLAFCRPGKDNMWSSVKGDDNVRFADVTSFQGKFYAVRHSGHVFVIEGLDSPSSINLVMNPPYRLASDRYYLVESLGELLLVMRTRYEKDDFDNLEEDSDSPISYQTTSFKVSKLDLDGLKWMNVYDLGKDCALFVGFNQSFSLKTSDFPGCKENCIYFTDDYYEHFMDEPFGGHDLGVFNLMDGVVEKCYPSDSIAIKPPPVWFTTHSC